MKIVPFRIPRTVTLPGLIVQVREVPPAELMGADGEWQYDTRDTAIIRLNRTLPLPIKRYTLIHELQHVMTDFLGMALEKYPRLIRPKRPDEVNKWRG